VIANDPFSHRGHGGEVIMRCNPDAMAASHRLAVDFFRRPSE